MHKTPEKLGRQKFTRNYPSFPYVALILAHRRPFGGRSSDPKKHCQLAYLLGSEDLERRASRQIVEGNACEVRCAHNRSI